MKLSNFSYVYWLFRYLYCEVPVQVFCPFFYWESVYCSLFIDVYKFLQGLLLFTKFDNLWISLELFFSISKITWYMSLSFSGLEKKKNFKLSSYSDFLTWFQLLMLSSWGPWHLRMSGSTKVQVPGRAEKSSSQYYRNNRVRTEEEGTHYYFSWDESPSNTQAWLVNGNSR